MLLDPNGEGNSLQISGFPCLTLQHQKAEKAGRGVL